MHLETVVPDIEDMQGVVSAQDGAEVLPVFRPQAVAGQPQLTKVLIELHCSHCQQRGGGGPSHLVTRGRGGGGGVGSLRMKVPLPERLLPSILSTCRLQLALTERRRSVSVCSSSPQ